MTTEREVLKWLHTETQDGQLHEDEVKSLFLEIEQALAEKNLLRRDFKKYKLVFYRQFCDRIYEHSR
jgi:hypothetical protein